MDQDLDPKGIESLESFGTPIIIRGRLLLLDSIESQETISNNHTIIPGEVLINPVPISSSENVPSLQFVGPVIFPSEIITNEIFGQQQINLNITFSGIESGEDFSIGIKSAGIPSEELIGNIQLNQNIQSVGNISTNESFFFVSVGSITLNSSIQTFEKFGIPRINKISNTPCISTLVKNHFPAFIPDNHPLFVDFIEAYFEWMEVKGNTIDQIYNLINYRDIDTTIDQFIDEFKNEFLVNVPNNILADKKQLLKNIKEFYRARGTEKSYRFFFRILFNQNSDFFFPRVDLLRPSDGKWVQNVTLKVKQQKGNIFDLQGNKIVGKNNNASAFVEKVQKIQEGPFTVFELFLNRSSITGLFEPDEIIEDINGDGNIGKIFPILTGIKIEDPGAEYFGFTDQEISITSSSGFGAKAVISCIDDEDGKIIRTKMKNFGVGYRDAIITFPDSPNISKTAIGSPIIGALATYEGFFLNSDGFPSDIKKLQDGVFWQQFSYVTIVGESLDRYKDALLKQLHPAGLQLFGQVRVENLLDSKVITAQPCSSIKLSFENLLFAGSRSIDTDYERELEITEDGFKIGPSLRSIDRNKFYYKPYESNDSSLEMSGGIQVDYWDLYGNAQIKDFGNFVIGDFVNRPYLRTNILPDPVLRTSDLTGIPSEEKFGLIVII